MSAYALQSEIITYNVGMIMCFLLNIGILCLSLNAIYTVFPIVVGVLCLLFWWLSYNALKRLKDVAQNIPLLGMQHPQNSVV